jgi:hypothetical protein
MPVQKVVFGLMSAPHLGQKLLSASIRLLHFGHIAKNFSVVLVRLCIFFIGVPKHPRQL